MNKLRPYQNSVKFVSTIPCISSSWGRCLANSRFLISNKTSPSKEWFNWLPLEVWGLSNRSTCSALTRVDNGKGDGKRMLTIFLKGSYIMSANTRIMNHAKKTAFRIYFLSHNFLNNLLNLPKNKRVKEVFRWTTFFHSTSSWTSSRSTSLSLWL